MTTATNVVGSETVQTLTEEDMLRQPIPWRSLAREAASLWLVWQVILIAFTYTSLTFAVANSLRVTPVVTVTPTTLYSSWVRLDSNWYLQIANSAYTVYGTLAFFPLYPLLIRIFSIITFGNLPLAAVLVARLGDFFVAFGMLALAWQELRGNRTLARIALAITLAYPLAFFLGAAYTESLFLAEVCFTLFFLRRRAWGLSALVAIIASLTHPRGIVLFLPMVWEWARVERPWEHWRDWRILRNGLLVVGAVPLGYLIIATIDSIALGGDPLGILHVHSSFGRVSLPPWLLIRLVFGVLFRSPPGTLTQAYNFSDIGLVLVITAIVVVAAVRRRMPIAFVLYSAGLIVLSIASPTPNESDAFLSAGRFILPSVPAFLALAAWSEKRPWLVYLAVGGGLCIEAVMAAFFLNGGWLI